MVHVGELMDVATQVPRVVGVGTCPPRLRLLQDRRSTSMWDAAGPITAVDQRMEGTMEVGLGAGVEPEAGARQIFVHIVP